MGKKKRSGQAGETTRQGDKPVEVVPFSLEEYKKSPEMVEWHKEELEKAEGGDTAAWERVGSNYLFGIAVERDLDKAFACFQKCDASAESWEDLGDYYKIGVDGFLNPDRARLCLDKAAAKRAAEEGAGNQRLDGLDEGIDESDNP